MEPSFRVLEHVSSFPVSISATTEWHSTNQSHEHPKFPKHPHFIQDPLQQDLPTPSLPLSSSSDPTKLSFPSQLPFPDEPPSDPDYSNNPLPETLMQAPPFPQIDYDAAAKMGRLKYAAKRKEEARAWFKENTKRKHFVSGEAPRFSRIRRGDSSYTSSQLKKRRLQMNQDSAAASRYAREEYILTLEKMVQSAETQISLANRENVRLRLHNEQVQAENHKLRAEVDEFNESDAILESLCAGKDVDKDQYEKVSRLFIPNGQEQASTQHNGFGVVQSAVKPAPAV